VIADAARARGFPWRNAAVAAACFAVGFLLVLAVRADDGLEPPVEPVATTATTTPTTAAPTTTVPPPPPTTPPPPVDEGEGRGNGNGNGNGRDRDRDRDD
jgi:hypothetical protein